MRFNNEELAHHWVYNDDRAVGSNMFSEGNSIYSYGYHFKIAQKFHIEGEGTIYLYNKDSYSVTTSTHQSHVWNAIPSHSRVFTVGFL